MKGLKMRNTARTSFVFLTLVFVIIISIHLSQISNQGMSLLMQQMKDVATGPSNNRSRVVKEGFEDSNESYNSNYGKDTNIQNAAGYRDTSYSQDKSIPSASNIPSASSYNPLQGSLVLAAGKILFNTSMPDKEKVIQLKSFSNKIPPQYSSVIDILNNNDTTDADKIATVQKYAMTNM